MVTEEQLKEFVTVSHFNLDRVKELYTQYPDMLNLPYAWQPDDHETAIMAAAHMGNRPIAEFLLEQGAPLAIYTAAMLNREDEVRRILTDDPGQATEKGGHGIPLMSHVALGGNTSIANLVRQHGNVDDLSFPLHAAVSMGHSEMVTWLVNHGANDLAVKNFQDQTLLQVAEANNHGEIVTLLRGYGATE